MLGKQFKATTTIKYFFNFELIDFTEGLNEQFLAELKSIIKNKIERIETQKNIETLKIKYQ